MSGSSRKLGEEEAWSKEGPREEGRLSQGTLCRDCCLRTEHAQMEGGTKVVPNAMR